MNADRATNYTHLMEYVRDVGPAKLLADEQERLRVAADTLVLSGMWDEEARTAMDDVETLGDHLVETGRWEGESAERLVETVRSVGPEAVPAGMSF